ncbi:MAG: HEAT repeat domain-containing protein [Thermoguttaceae bacterium]
MEQTTEPGAREKNNSHQTPVSNRICSINQIGSVVSDEQAISQLVEKDVVDLLRAINGGNQTSGKAAEAELIRHGFTEAQIALCCHMLDPDPQVRKRLVQVLPGLPNVDATAWLLRLCHDSDAEVRLAAMQFLATSSNPLVLNELEQIARRDPDAAIQRLADRLATGQKKSR